MTAADDERTSNATPLYFPDTDTCIDALRGSFPAIQRHMRRLSPASIRMASIVRAELLLGAEKSLQPDRTRSTVIAFLRPFAVADFDSAAATAYARIRAELERRGEVIGPNDLILGATVLSRGGILVTRNAREFDRVEGLVTADWTR